MRKRIVIFTCIFLLISGFISKIKSNFSIEDFAFKQVSYEQGLPGMNLRKQFQDSKGIIWISVEAMGVCKYNGYKFERFSHVENNNESLSSNFVNDINEDQSGNIWFATENGLNMYNRETANFTVYKKNDNNPNSLPNDVLHCIGVSPSGMLWVGSENGLVRFDPVSKVFRRYLYNNIPADNNSQISVHSLLIESDTIIWIGTDNGLYKLNTLKEKYEHWSKQSNSGNSLVHNRIRSIAKDYKGNLWLGTHRGLDRFKIAVDSFIHFNYKTSKDLTELDQEGVNNVFIDRHNRLWVGTYTKGLLVIDVETENYRRITKDDKLEFPLRSDHIVYINEDNMGVIWLGTKFEGLYKYIDRKAYLGEWPEDLIGLKDLQYQYIMSFYEDLDQIYWMGSKFNGLYKIDAKNNVISNFQHQLNTSTSLASNRVQGILRDSKNRLWIATEGGLDVLDEKSGTFQHYSDMPTYKIIEDHRGVLWLATIKGVFIVDEINNTIKRYESNVNSFFSRDDMDVLYLFRDSKNNVWFSTRNDGLYWFNPVKNVFRHFNSYYPFLQQLEACQVRAVFEDRDKNIWICTKAAGLLMFSHETEKFVSYTTDQGLPSNFILAINEDFDGNIWLGTHNGVSKFNRKELRFQNFNKDYGLNSNITELGVGHRFNNGSILFGGNNGFNIFNPSKIKPNNDVSKIIITSLKIVEKEIYRDIDSSITIHLDYNQNSLAFEFSITDYKDPYRHEYKYYLKGLENDFISIYNRNFCNYTNLDPGSYTFIVKGANELGNWNIKPLKINIVISPPIFTTWWFRILAFFILIAAVIITYFQKVTQVRKNQEFLEGQIKERTHKLELAYQEVLDKNKTIEGHRKEIEMHSTRLEEKVRERTKDLELAKRKAEDADKLKTSFLANMSHEIRTPINAIAGFSNLIGEDNLTMEEKENYISVINENTSMLLKLIEDILDISKIEAGQIRIKKDLFNINSVFNDVFTLYSNKIATSSKTKSIRLNWVNQESKNHFQAIFSDHIRMKQIVINLMENAVKYTHSGSIDFGYKLMGNDLKIFVKDTGIGISETDREAIFKRFVKIEEKSALYRGTGIGLTITKGLVELLQGEISVESEVGRGSTFTVLFPDVVDSVTPQNVNTNREIPRNFDFHGKSILIVEDEDSNFFLLNSYLKKTGVNIMRAVDGYDAIDIVKVYKFDLILLDLKLPNLNGYETLEILKKDYKNLPVIAQTAYALPEDKHKIMAHGFTDFLVKPIMKKELMEKIFIYMK